MFGYIEYRRDVIELLTDAQTDTIQKSYMKFESYQTLQMIKMYGKHTE